MGYSRDFIDGFRTAITELGREGDYRDVDWSKPYQFLRKRIKDYEPKAIPEYRGIKIVTNPRVPPNMIEFHHPDGRRDVFKIGASRKQPRR